MCLHRRERICLQSRSESESEIAQSCPTLCDPVDCNLPGSSIHGILQARILEWVAIYFSRESSWPRDWTWVSHLAGRCFNLWATREARLTKNAIQPSFGLNTDVFMYICITYVCTQMHILNLLRINTKEWMRDFFRPVLKTRIPRVYLLFLVTHNKVFILILNRISIPVSF